MPQINPLQGEEKFQGYTEKAQFNPINVPDPNQGLGNLLGNIDSSFQSMQASGQAKYAQEAAKWQQLSQFSQTLTQAIGVGYKLYDENAKDQALAEFNMDERKQQEALARYEPLEATLNAVNAAHDEQALAAQKAGAPIEIVEKMKSMSGRKGYYYNIHAAKDAGDSLKNWIQDQETNNKSVVKFEGKELPLNDPRWDPAERAGIRKMMEVKYMKQYGLDQVNPGMVAKYYLPGANKAQEELMADTRKQYGIAKSAESTDLALAKFDQDNDLSQLSLAVASTVDENGRPRGFAGAWKLIEKHMTERFDAGNMNEQQLQAIENQIDPETGKRMVERWPTRFSLWREGRAAENRKNFADDEAQKEQQFKQEENALQEYFATNKPSQADVEAAEKDLFQKYGKTSSYLTTLKSTYTIDAEAGKRLNDQFQNLAEQGLLTPEMVSHAPWEVQQKWAKTAENQAKASSASGNYKSQLDAISNSVKRAPRVIASPGGPMSGSATLVISDLQAKFHRKVAEYVGSDLMTGPQAAQQAVGEVMNEFNQGVDSPSSRYYINGIGEFTNILPKDLAKKSISLNTKLNNIRQKLIDTHGAALQSTEGLMFDKNELLAIERSYGQPGWRVPPVATYWARELNINWLDLINRQRQAAKLKPLPTPGAIEAAKGSVAPELQYLFNRFQSPNRSTRALSSVGAFNPVFVPNGYGSTVQKAAQKNGIPPEILAGLLETENGWRATGVSSSGARGIAQIMPEYHPEVNADDPIASINFAAKYLSGLQRQFGGDMRLAIIAYNAGPGNVAKYRGPIPGSRESQDYYGKVIKASSKYGYGQAWSDPSTMRGKFNVIEHLSGDTSRPEYRANHGGNNYHEHLAFASTAERDTAIKKLQAAGIQVGSVDRPGDAGYHGKKLAIDVPGSQVAVGKEKELSRRVRQVLGIS
jgi:soluble lytic murein transglycosylase-like protein